MKWAGTRLKEAVTILNRYEIHRRRQFSYRKRADYIPKKASQFIRKQVQQKRMKMLKENNLLGQMWKMLANQNAVKNSWSGLKERKIATSNEATLITIQDGIIWTSASCAEIVKKILHICWLHVRRCLLQ